MRDMLEHFRICVDDKKYTERIPYDIWREIKKSDNRWRIKFLSPSNISIYKDGSTIPLFCSKTYDWGFGRFFWDNVVKKENERMNLSTKATSATAYSVAETAKIVGDPIMSINGTINIGYDLDSSTSISNYGTTTTDNTWLNADQLVYNDTAIKTANDHYANSWIGINDTKVDKTEFDALQKKVEEHLKNENKNKCEENSTMMKGFNFDFGPVKDIVHMSMYGMAIKNKNGVYVSYDKINDTLMDVDILNFEGANKFMFKMPVPVKDIHAGDIIVHNDIPCFVKNTPDSQIKTFAVIDPYEGEYREIIIPKSMFGFDYATKVVNLMEGMFGNITASAENPFGNMLPLLMLNDGAKSDDMLPMMLMMSQNTSGTNMFSNPMMMYMMFKDNKDTNLPMMMMLANQCRMTNEAKCACNCTDKK